MSRQSTASLRFSFQTQENHVRLWPHKEGDQAQFMACKKPAWLPRPVFWNLKVLHNICPLCTRNVSSGRHCDLTTNVHATRTWIPLNEWIEWNVIWMVHIQCVCRCVCPCSRNLQIQGRGGSSGGYTIGMCGSVRSYVILMLCMIWNIAADRHQRCTLLVSVHYIVKWWCTTFL